MMIPIASIEQIRAIEAAADADGYSYESMMDAAGRAVADRANALLDGIDSPRVTILVGAGNNGGDGLVAGLYMAQDNPDVDVRFYLLADRDDTYTQTVEAAGLFLAKSEDDADKRLLRNMVASADLVIDALFGIGVRLPIQGEAQKILRNVNHEVNARRSATPDSLIINPARSNQVPSAPPIKVLAVDCPSGVNCDTGEQDSNVIPADETITFIAAKKGLLHYPAADSAGDLLIADIGISSKLAPLKAIQDFVVDADTVKQKLQHRTSDGHKGTFGRAFVLAGSINYIGAPALAAEAAYRAGAGLVTVGAPSSVIMALAGQLREVTWMMLPHDMGVIAEGAAQMVFKDINKMKSLLIGPGLGTEKTTGEFIKTILTSSQNSAKKPSRRSLGFGIQPDDADKTDTDNDIMIPPLVIDADGLNLLAEMDEWWTLLPTGTIITPHPGEMARLCDIETADVQANRWELAREKAKEWDVIVVLKGAYTVIASPNDLVVLPFAVDALATAGTGDVLAGLIVGLLAQGIQPLDAAIIAAYVHGLAGTVLAHKTSSRSVTAGDVIASIGEAFKQIES
ncbi:MAG: NAD(P)H-hydrate dehydratase [Phototrophicaceae bacterium]